MTGAERRRLAGHVERFAGRELLVLGDLVADAFVHGDIERVSREAPVLILRETGRMHVPGCGGNTVMNVVALGGAARVLGAVGRDEAGERLKDVLAANGARVRSVLGAPRYATPTKTRIVAGGVHTRRQQVVRLDRGGDRLPASVGDRLAKALARGFASGAGLVVADYGFGAATPEILSAAYRLTRERPAFVLVDSRRRLTSYSRVTAATPNQEEVEQALGIHEPLDDRAVKAAARKLFRKLGAEALCVTRGSKGMWLVTEGRSEAIPAFGPDEVADVTGAGDTVTATFAMALAAGAPFRDAAKLANVAAGLAVMKAGTATVAPAELQGALLDGDAR